MAAALFLREDVTESALRTGIYFEGSDCGKLLANVLESAPTETLPLSCLNTASEYVFPFCSVLEVTYMQRCSSIAFFATEAAAKMTNYPQTPFWAADGYTGESDG